MRFRSMPVVVLLTLTDACSPGGFDTVNKALSDATLVVAEETQPFVSDAAQRERHQVRQARIAKNQEVIDLTVDCANYTANTFSTRLDQCSIVYFDDATTLTRTVPTQAIEISALLVNLEDYANALNLLASSSTPTDIGACTASVATSLSELLEVTKTDRPGGGFSRPGKAAQSLGALSQTAAQHAQTTALRRAVTAGDGPLNLAVLKIVAYLRVRQPEWPGIVQELNLAQLAVDDALDAQSPSAHAAAVRRLEAAGKKLIYNEKISPIPLLY